MQNFAEQCMDMARSLIGYNLKAINKEDGHIQSVNGEKESLDDPGHAALAIGELYRATHKLQFENYDLVEIAARCISVQTFMEKEENENGLGYAALGLLSFGPAKDRNPVWERLSEETQIKLDQRLLARTDYPDHRQAFNIAKAVTRYSMKLSQKDETGRLIDLFLERIRKNSVSGFHDDGPDQGIGGVFDITGILSVIFIRQALQLHANHNLREHKLPSLRTFGEKYINMLPDIVREDGLGWCYGQRIGAYGQMHCISILLQGMRDNWIKEARRPQFNTILRQLFHYFFTTYLDQEHGFLVIRDQERNTVDAHTTRIANFDATRFLCQWARLARSIGGELKGIPCEVKTSGRFVVFSKKSSKEQGLFIYRDKKSKLHVQIPLVSAGGKANSNADSLSFPHCPGIFDWPAVKYQPVFIPELTFGDQTVIPCFYGKRCTTGMGLHDSFFFRYEQPELITMDEKITSGLGSIKVCWSFSKGVVKSEFIFSVKNLTQMDRMRYLLVFAVPHSTYRLGSTYAKGPKQLDFEIIRNDFLATLKPLESVKEDLAWRTYYGNILHVQWLTREHPLIMKPGLQYGLTLSFRPDIVLADSLKGFI